MGSWCSFLAVKCHRLSEARTTARVGVYLLGETGDSPPPTPSLLPCWSATLTGLIRSALPSVQSTCPGSTITLSILGPSIITSQSQRLNAATPLKCFISRAPPLKKGSCFPIFPYLPVVTQKRSITPPASIRGHYTIVQVLAARLHFAVTLGSKSSTCSTLLFQGKTGGL